MLPIDSARTQPRSPAFAVALAPLAALVLAALGPPGRALAHDPPNEELAELDEALAESPQDVALLQARAELYLRERQPERAAADLLLARTVTGDQPSVPSALLWAEVWRQRGRLAEAEAELDPAVEAGSLEALVARAAIRAAAGRWLDALHDYQAAIERRPTVGLALGRGQALEALGRPADAARAYRQDIARLGGATVIRTARLRVLQRLGAWDEALMEVDALLRRSPAKTRWLLVRGELLEQAGRSDEARAAREAALRESVRVLRRRRSLAARLLHGKALMSVGRWSEARRELLRVQSASPELAAEASALLERIGGSR